MCRHAFKITMVFLALISISSLAYAGHHGENDAQPVLDAKTTLSQAIAVAEKYANGRASQAEYEPTKAGKAYHVEVVSQFKVYDVRVDADKGTVLSSVEDKDD
jgi:uncharacterized membrane protein YkoI